MARAAPCCADGQAPGPHDLVRIDLSAAQDSPGDGAHGAAACAQAGLLRLSAVTGAQTEGAGWQPRAASAQPARRWNPSTERLRPVCWYCSLPRMYRERLSPTHFLEELRLRPPASGDPWQRRSPKAVTSSGERKRVRVVSCTKDEAEGLLLVIVDDYGPSPRPRTIKLTSFVWGYEPGDELMAKYDRICRARPARTRLSSSSGFETQLRRILNAPKRPKGRLERAAGVRRQPR